MYRNTSEELFLKSLMENSAPTIDMLGFKNFSSQLVHRHHNFRIDSEELFKTWLTNGENHDYNSPSIAHRARQGSRRISTELSNLASQQPLQTERSNDVDYPVPETPSSELNHQYDGNSMENVSSLNFAKAWFHSCQPMTRSRSSELRKRYAAMQNGPSHLRQQHGDPVNDIGNQIGDVDRVSSVVTMLKGTIERKKLGYQDASEDSYNAVYHAQQVLASSSFDQEKHEIPQCFQEMITGQFNDGGGRGTAEFDFEGFVNPINQVSTISREQSLSESSAPAPVVSPGCDGPSVSTQTLNICESSRKSTEKGTRSKDFRERIIENLKDGRKRGGLVRHGSVTSINSADKGDPTKKRRVERSRKMAEAKERNSAPAIPSDMQTLLKRCENLEKEVRSLKLNLSFMNRKDSEQTKQIEELQKQNEDLSDEKERLLEEIERILNVTTISSNVF